MEQRFLFDFLQKWQRISAKFGIYWTYDYYVATQDVTAVCYVQAN